MKMSLHPLRSLRQNLRDIGTAISASRQYTQATRSKTSPPCDTGIHF
ncbi:hypothetical protein ACQKKX_13440 [Neorhizobium sp. NPDC001467]